LDFRRNVDRVPDLNPVFTVSQARLYELQTASGTAASRPASAVRLPARGGRFISFICPSQHQRGQALPNMSDSSTRRTPKPGRATIQRQLAETRLGRLTAWAALISLVFNLAVPLGVAAAPAAPADSASTPASGSPAASPTAPT